MSSPFANRLRFRHPLTGTAQLEMPLDHARWFASLLSQLQERQVRQAFEAAGASPEQVQGFSVQVLRRIGELTAAVQERLQQVRP